MNDFKKKVVYQIYPKSFKDTNGTGTGDLKGVIEKLDYLQTLGVDYIWLTPFYVSPQNDNGYDVADYYNIDPSYGTMEDVENLIAEAKKRNIYLMMDMVFNHVSTEHIWFKKAMAGEEKYLNYFFFKQGKANNQPPTNWNSKFGGPAWEYVEKFDKWYLHLFDKTQADLNWENPEVREEVKNIVRFWMEKGVKGFRFDVINLISKAGFEDDFSVDGDGRSFYTDGPRIHEFLQELARDSFAKDKDIITVGEMSSTTMENCYKYAGEKTGELSMVFTFHHLKVDFMGNEKWVLVPTDFMKLKQLIFDWQINMEKNNAWNAVFWCNHDQPRVISRFGSDDKYHKESGKMLATLIHCLRGTPYIYQGEEIGMTNIEFNDLADFADIESVNAYKERMANNILKEEILKSLRAKARDNARTPMQWNSDVNAGFSKVKPWYRVNRNYIDVNVEKALADKNSIFYCYQKLIKMRKENPIMIYGEYDLLLAEDKNIFAYTRKYEDKTWLIICNFYDKEVDFNLEGTGKILISNYEDTITDLTKGHLRPYEAVIYQWQK